MHKIALLQPFVPHYREEFFLQLQAEKRIDIYCYDNKSVISEGFAKSNVKCKLIFNINFKGIVLYNLFILLKKEYEQLILMLDYKHVSTWVILFLKPFHKKKIILWGHGISTKRYLKEEKKPNPLLKWMIKYSDVVWLYTDKEAKLWKSFNLRTKIIALGNTISDVNCILQYKQEKSKQILKKEFNIQQPICFIFSARFNEYRRIDLLMQIIKILDKDKFGFIIIGAGKSKPDFSTFNNVYDFGAVYDRELKNKLFSMADIYLQPAWLGLSVVEAMAYKKPVFTFKRHNNLFQCVEYSYIENNENGKIFNDIDDFLSYVTDIKTEEIEKLSINAYSFVLNNVNMENMIKQALTTL